MSAPSKDPGEDPKRPPDSPQSPASKRLRDRVSFFEKVWTGTRSGAGGEGVDINVEELERRLAEERARHAGPSQFEHVTLKHTPSSSPKHVVHTQDVNPDGSFQARLFLHFFLSHNVYCYVDCLDCGNSIENAGKASEFTIIIFCYLFIELH